MAKTTSRPATEGALNELHAAVANVLTHKMTPRTVKRVVKEEVVEEDIEPTAAEIAAAITFLKNNNIQAVPEEDSAMAVLRQQVEAAKERAKSRLPDQHAAMPPGMH